MFKREDLDIAGRLTLQKRSLDGRLLGEISAHNDITLDGRSLVARLFNHDTTSDNMKRVSKIHVGKGSTPFDPSQKALAAEIAVVDVSKIETVQVSDATGRPRALLRLTGELDENTANDTLLEAGLFTEDNVMYNRVTFPTITKSNQFKLTLVWEIMF